MEDEMIIPEMQTSRLMNVVKLATDYCAVCESSQEMEKGEFIDRILDLLPRIYWEFFDLQTSKDEWEEEGFFADYLDEDYYENIRRHIETVIGEDDLFLETFEEDMKYSETPISASISESLADIFQPLFNFVSVVRDSEGLQLTEAFKNCKEEFENYWSQTLCNVLRAINNIKYSHK